MSTTPELPVDARDGLVSVLEDAQRRSYVGPGPVDAHIDHALGFACALESTPMRVVDLGTGGGVPGLVLALLWPATEVILVEASQHRADHLRRSVHSLDLEEWVVVRHERAEVTGRDPALRGSCAAVVARGFGRPSIVAECGGPLLAEGGVLVTSEPPEDDGDRWPSAGVAQVGLRPDGVRLCAEARFHRCISLGSCDERFPRRPGIPERRPLF